MCKRGLRERVVQIHNYNLLSLAAMDLPQINYREYNGKKYSFVYGVSGGDFLLKASVCLMQINFCYANHISGTHTLFYPPTLIIAHQTRNENKADEAMAGRGL